MIDVEIRESPVRDWLHRVRQAWNQVVGIPDYERYLAHHAEHHPGEPALSREAFVAQAIDRKYCRNGPRCC
jgi:uncharacterized short protein YbdD (DUF466 family)